MAFRTMAQVRQQLGFSRQTIYNLVQLGQLKIHKVKLTAGARAARFDSDEVDELERTMKGGSPHNAAVVAKPPSRRRPPPLRSPARKTLTGVIEFA